MSKYACIESKTHVEKGAIVQITMVIRAYKHGRRGLSSLGLLGYYTTYYMRDSPEFKAK